MKVIIFAGGAGGSLDGFETCQALLPLANFPLVSYSLDWVAAAGFTDALLIACASFVFDPFCRKKTCGTKCHKY